MRWNMIKPPWKRRDVQKALAAVEALTQQNELAKAAARGLQLNVCIAALEKVWDKSLLEFIALKANKHAVRVQACEKLGHVWVNCECSRCGIERDENHQWVEYTDKSDCPQRGSGQHLDPCYGASCLECSTYYKCSLCGKVKK